MPLDQGAFDGSGRSTAAPAERSARGHARRSLGSVTSLAVLVTAGWRAAGAARSRARRSRSRGSSPSSRSTSPRTPSTGRAPSSPHSNTGGFAYPSGHAAYSVALVACAVVLARGGHRWSTRVALVTVAVVIAAGVGASRVYLRAHYLSDVVGGLALGTAIYSLVGVVALVIGVVRHTDGR